jgi:hypothetical protein
MKTAWVEGSDHLTIFQGLFSNTMKQIVSSCVNQ